MPIKLLTFDLDDTLWPCMITITRTEERLHQWFSQHHPYIPAQYNIKQLREKRTQLVTKHQHIAHDLTAVRKKSFALLSREMGYSPEQEKQFIQAAYEFYINERNKVSLYEDVIPTLKTLKADFRLGAVSNGNADIYQVGLGHLFDFSWSAADAGKQKPHPIVFNSLLEKQQLEAHEVIHIGDDPLTDIQGAQQSGIRAIWLNRDHLPWPEKINPPFIEIDQLNQLPDILKALLDYPQSSAIFR
ncbi:HAD family hydrolase [sulfur-oxidizing endosymbiont of Gigantopelta aegis]|uniref:HAD family hydrolase n=1 Tax=sulfur-oxidizing endosymbiont of Gigantopelta aegis TaxID=2794934 RepID=UPI002483D1DC|nr:HAD family hydrolase [sulfur-oxidizing endosymbiont of Gigantopelta aegis]